LAGLKSILKIKRHDQPVSAMLEPDQTFFLYQNLILQLEGARVALLRKDQSLFNTSLERAVEWAQKFFDQKDSVTESMLHEIEELRQLQLTADMPDISGSLRMLMVQQGRGDEMLEPEEEAPEEEAPEQIAEEEKLPENPEQAPSEEQKTAVAEESAQDSVKQEPEAGKKEAAAEEQKAEDVPPSVDDQPVPDEEQAPAVKEQKEGS
jgi:uncharacterized protein HemX